MRGLAGVSTADLRTLERLIETGKLGFPLTALDLEHVGLGHLRAVSMLVGLDRQRAKLGIEVALAEREASPSTSLDLVWSGPDAGPTYAQYTKQVIPELLEAARRNVTIAGYSFDEGAGVFETLARAMSERRVSVRFFVDILQLEERLGQQLGKERRRSRLAPVRAAAAAGLDAHAREIISLFLEAHWHTDWPRPAVYYDPRTADPKSFASLHAKCLIVDHEIALITSANFTDRGQTRNIEVGALVRSKDYATALERQWDALVDSSAVVLG